jgi:hypothetical protein
MRSRARRFFQNLFVIFTATTAVMLPATIAVRAAENDELHEIETKYIFGTFTVGSSTGIEGEKAFEPETQANFGTGGGGRYSVGATTLEYEYTPTQYLQVSREVSLGPQADHIVDGQAALLNWLHLKQSIRSHNRVIAPPRIEVCVHRTQLGQSRRRNSVFETRTALAWPNDAAIMALFTPERWGNRPAACG